MFKKMAHYFIETKEELLRVSWPSRQNVIKHTLLVVMVSLGVAVYLGAADLLFNYGLAQLLSQ